MYYQTEYRNSGQNQPQVLLLCSASETKFTVSSQHSMYFFPTQGNLGTELHKLSLRRRQNVLTPITPKNLQVLQKSFSPQQQLFCKKSALPITSHPAGDAPSPLSLPVSLIIPCQSKAEVLALPSSSPLGFCLIKA